MNDISAIQDKFGEYLFKYIRSRTSSTEDAQDIYQDVIYKILTKSGQIKKTQSLKAWLFMIARNEIVNHHRNKKNILDVENIPPGINDQESRDEAYTALESCLGSFIEALPEMDKLIIKQSELEGKSQKELSEELGINYITLRSRVQRGRTKIKEMISAACEIEKDKMGRISSCTSNPLSPKCTEGTSSSCS